MKVKKVRTKLKTGMKVEFTENIDGEKHVFICCLKDINGWKLVDIEKGHHWGVLRYKTLESLLSSLGRFKIKKEEN